MESSSVKNITSAGFALHVDISASGTVYAVAIDKNDPAPGSSQVKEGQNSSGAMTVHNSVTLTSGAYAGTITLNAPNADRNTYKVYYVLESGGNLDETPSVLDVLVPNTAPAIAIADTTLSYEENSAACPLDTEVTASDADGDADWTDGKLEVQITANAEASDRISIPDNKVGNINTEGTDLKDGTTVIGTLSASEGTVTNGTELTVTFNSNATNTLVQQVVRAVHYDNTSEKPGTSDRTVTVTLTDKKSASANDTRIISVTSKNDLPTLTGFDSAVHSTNEDTGVEIALADLKARGDENDVDGTIDAFVIKSVVTGSLKIGTDAASATAYAATTNDTIDSSKKAYWTPDANASGTLNAFTVVAMDNDGGESTDGNITAQVTVTAQNDPPTLTSFDSAVDTTDEDTEVQITLADLKAQGNEADVDGTVDAFVIKGVSTGSLKIGTDAASATAYAATTNDTVDSSKKAYWTPAANANGPLDAFTVVAKDDEGAESTGGNITAKVTVAALNDRPTDITLSSDSVNENQPPGTVVGTFSASDPDN